MCQCRSDTYHLNAGVPAAKAFLSADPAMLHAMLRMLLAFFGTALTNSSAELTDLFGENTFEAHNGGSCFTDGGTFKICLYTGNQHLHFFFLQTGSSALTASGGAGQACFDAFAVLLIDHLSF
ncbi:MAG: hypothetical protein ACTHMC_17195 [Pseudobacter sp.]|uniref:hypothetical protein n=1 Tax=Pseudobacter sp. TaxID=2045420 RepID=UPI003F7EBE8B